MTAVRMSTEPETFKDCATLAPLISLPICRGVVKSKTECDGSHILHKNLSAARKFRLDSSPI